MLPGYLLNASALRWLWKKWKKKPKPATNHNAKLCKQGKTNSEFIKHQELFKKQVQEEFWNRK